MIIIYKYVQKVLTCSRFLWILCVVAFIHSFSCHIVQLMILFSFLLCARKFVCLFFWWIIQLWCQFVVATLWWYHRHRRLHFASIHLFYTVYECVCCNHFHLLKNILTTKQNISKERFLCSFVKELPCVLSKCELLSVIGLYYQSIYELPINDFGQTHECKQKHSRTHTAVHGYRAGYLNRFSADQIRIKHVNKEIGGGGGGGVCMCVKDFFSS